VPALVLCFTTGTELEDASKRAFVCLRREASWLGGGDALAGFGTGFTLALSMMMCLLVTLFVVRRYPRLMAHRRLFEPARAAAANARLRELRDQLAQIPESPPPVSRRSDSPPEDDAEGRQDLPLPSRTLEIEEGTAAAPLPAPPLLLRENSLRSLTSNGLPECSICQSEVTVRVALRPCGHTACRACAARLVEAGQRCHMCRAEVEGVQPVYI